MRLYQRAGRTDLLEKEKKEIEIINEFLPKQMSDEEMKKICEATVKI